MDDLFNEDQLTSISEINKAGEHLLHLISDLLDLAKIEAGRMQLKFEDLQLWEIIEECHHLVLPTAERGNITISCCNGESCSDAIVHADRVRLKQVVLNIVSNAVKYNSVNGKVDINVQSIGEYVRLSVQDTGKGIPPHHMNELFSAFNRLGAETSTIEGTGIGLVISKNLIELMQGRIQADSTPGQGTTFHIDIPTAVLSGRTEDQTRQNTAKIKHTHPADTSMHTVLYIEDNPENMRLVTRIMKHRPNIKLLTAMSGQEGLDICQLEKPHLILLDINLPLMDGYELLKKLRQNETTRQIPVIAVSANAMNSDIERGLSAGFAEYITKPINVRKLLDAIDLAVDHKQGAA
jgi:hypothetical protein